MAFIKWKEEEKNSVFVNRKQKLSDVKNYFMLQKFISNIYLVSLSGNKVSILCYCSISYERWKRKKKKTRRTMTPHASIIFINAFVRLLSFSLSLFSIFFYTVTNIGTSCAHTTRSQNLTWCTMFLPIHFIVQPILEIFGGNARARKIHLHVSLSIFY